MKNTLTILHLSDFHFKVKGEFDRSVVLDPLLERIKNDTDKGLEAEIVIISGDIAFSGKEEEYDLAGTYIDNLLSICQLSKEQIFIVPGNHDVDRDEYFPTDNLSYPDMKTLNIELESEKFRNRRLLGMNNYFTFINTNYNHLKSIHGNLIPFVCTYTSSCGKNIGLIGLNSAWMCRKSNEKPGNIAIGEYQAKRAFQEFSKEEQIDITFCIFHHPFSWLWRIDMNILQQYMNGKIILAGHLHEPGGGYFHTLNGQYYQFQAGSAYLRSESDWPNRYHYQTINWETKKLQLDFRKFNKENRKWVLDADTGNDGKKVFSFLQKPDNGNQISEFTPIPEKYCTWINENYGYMDASRLYGKGEAIPLQLPKVYVPLYSKNNPFARQSIDIKSDKGSEGQEPVDIEIIMALCKHLLIVGDPGSGKTTLFKHFAWALVNNEGLDIPDTNLYNMVPVLIFLKEIKAYFIQNKNGINPHGIGEDILFWYIKNRMDDDIFSENVLRLFLNTGKVFILLDGLDECEEAFRDRVVNAFYKIPLKYLFSIDTKYQENLDKKATENLRLLFAKNSFQLSEKVSISKEKKGEQWIIYDDNNKKNQYNIKKEKNKLNIYKYTGNRVAITSRPYGVTKAVANLFDSTKIKILDLDPEHVERFIRRWFTYLYSMTGGIGKKNADAMVDEIGNNFIINTLTTNPLMLTAVCLLYHAGKKLPEQRADLYKRFIDNLLHRRFPPIEPDIVHDFLKTLAYRMHSEEHKSADKAFIIPIAQDILIENGHGTAAKDREIAEKIFNDIEPRCGLLRRNNGQYSFSHLTFQEFLTARYLADSSVHHIEVIKPYWEDDWFKEVIELYISYLSIDFKKIANEIILSTLKDKDRPPYKRWFLAGRAMLDISDRKRDKKVLDKLINTLRTIFECKAEPTQIVEAGEIIGWLGDTWDLRKFVKVSGGIYELEWFGTVSLKDFEIGKYPVTNAWFKEFIDDGGYENESFWTEEGKKWLRYKKKKKPSSWYDKRYKCPNWPVAGICWYEAVAFTHWLTQKDQDGYIYRLPNEEEWQAVAAGKEGKIFPWGNSSDGWNIKRCNHSKNIGNPSSVGIFVDGNTPASDNHLSEQVSDLAGNIWEWVNNGFYENKALEDFIFIEESQKQGKSEWLTYLKTYGNIPVLRGNSWHNNQYYCRCSFRNLYPPTRRWISVGFRCVRTLSFKPLFIKR